MAELVIQHATKRFGKFVAVDDVSLTVRDREFVVLLGPSGCGKTTLLRAVAGLGMVDSGKITVGGRDITYLPPRERNISMVFQNYAIFPHMSVYENIAFGLRMKKMPQNVIEERVHHAAKLLHIESMLQRSPSQMSGGQRQRIAVARAIAVQSEILLMDEPLSNLDALLRLEMRAELKALLASLGATTIYVTHDQIEALSMGDRIAVMKQGKILHCDHPTKVYDMPVDQFVGGFIGNPPMNFLQGQVVWQEGSVRVQVGAFQLTPSEEYLPVLRAHAGKPIILGIRAENMEALARPAADALEVTVEVVEPLGSQNLLTIHVNGDTLKVSTHPDFAVRVGERIWLRFPAHKIRWFDAQTRRSLAPDLQQVLSPDHKSAERL